MPVEKKDPGQRFAVPAGMMHEIFCHRGLGDGAELAANLLDVSQSPGDQLLSLTQRLIHVGIAGSLDLSCPLLGLLFDLLCLAL